MNPQTIKYTQSNEHVKQLIDSNTFIMDASMLQWGSFAWPPTIIVEGIVESKKLKFEFHKVYTNAKNEIVHCEYRNTLNGFKLIIFNN